MAYEVKSFLRKVGYQVLSQTGEHVILADEPVRVGGTDAGANPVQYLLTALNSCLSITARSIAKNHSEIGLKKFEVTSTGVVQRATDKTSHVAEIKVKIALETELDSKAQDKFVKSVIKYCTIHGTLAPAVEIKFEY
jgi:uncharacterized OsmC-like protein